MLVPIQFGVDTIEVTPPSDTRNLINLRRCCESFGLDFSSQLKKLRGHAWATMVIITTVAEDGRRREVTMVDLPTFHGWLLSLNAGKIKPEFRAKLDAYQKHAFRFIADYFSGQLKTAQQPEQLGSWYLRFLKTLRPHQQALAETYPAGHFTILTATANHLISLEQVMWEHLLPTAALDRPDISVGKKWGDAAPALGCLPSPGYVPVHLPDQDIMVSVKVYCGSDRTKFDSWLVERYFPEHLYPYLKNKESLEVYSHIPKASAADLASRTLAGRPANLPDKERRQLIRAKSLVRVGEEHKALPPSTPSLF